MEESEDLPMYTEEGPDFHTSIQDLLSSLGDHELPIHQYPESTWRTMFDDDNRAAREMYEQIVTTFFAAIRSKNKDVVAAMIQNNIVTPNTTGSSRETPLLAAIDNDDIRMVQCLVDFGAEIDGFGAWDGSQRTPLQLAASKGHLALVRLFVEVFHADDAKLAPDGELALRLAVQNGHPEVVSYLPARRKGGWLRWKTHHSKAMRRLRKAYEAIISFFRITLWEIPKFFLWSCPKHLFVLPAYKCGKWCWNKRHAAAHWCAHQAHELPRRVKRACKAVGKGAKDGCIATGKLIQKIPSLLVSLSKAIWKLFTVILPRLLMATFKFLYVLITKHIPNFIISTSKWIWKFLTLLFTKWIPSVLKWVWKVLVELITKKIPSVAKKSSQWVWSGVKSIAAVLFNIVQRVLSFFHTAVMAIISRLRQITLQDVWNAFCSVLHSVFVAVPSKVWSWVREVPEVVYHALKTIFGVVGQAVWIIGWLLITVIIFVPVQLGVMVGSLGGSAAKALEEILVWMNPKR